MSVVPPWATPPARQPSAANSRRKRRGMEVFIPVIVSGLGQIAPRRSYKGSTADPRPGSGMGQPELRRLQGRRVAISPQVFQKTDQMAHERLRRAKGTSPSIDNLS